MEVWRTQKRKENLVGMDGLLLRKEKQNSRLGLDWFWGERKMATLLAQARSALVQASSPSAQVKAAEVQAGDRNWNWGKKSYIRTTGVFLHKTYFAAVRDELASIAALVQA